MSSNFNLEIKTPCSEDFNTFSKTKDGGFCNSCTKEVIDFTRMNEEEIITYFKTHSAKNTCGRFNSHQLNTANNTSSKNKFLNLFSGISLACLSLLTFSSVKAQNIKKQSIKKDTSNLQSIKNSITVKGTVTEDGLAMPGVNVILEGTAIGVQTNFDGFFEFPKQLKKGDVLVFSFIGMTSKKVTIENNKSASNVQLQVDLKSCDMILMGKVAVKEVYTSKRGN